jgi:hypothetical protein
MHRLSPRHWMVLGLLLVSLGIGLRAIGPAALRNGPGDLVMGLLLGVGIGIELMALLKMRRAR